MCQKVLEYNTRGPYSVLAEGIFFFAEIFLLSPMWAFLANIANFP